MAKIQYISRNLSILIYQSFYAGVMHIKNVLSYQEFLNKRIDDKLIDKLTIIQKQSLLEAYVCFPLGLEVKTNLNEIITFLPQDNHCLNEYIHHFLVKFNNGKDWFSKKYLNLLNLISGTIQSYDDRILHIQGDSDRLCYIKRYGLSSSEGSIIHVVACNLMADKIIAWTHFNAKENYIKTLYKIEKDLIEKRGVTDQQGNLFRPDYENYLHLKRKTLLYLGSNVLSGLHRSQESPPDLTQNCNNNN